jgi:tRNA(Leu) C34 or U34 (ribose-2'-O)-methylase TrmL
MPSDGLLTIRQGRDTFKRPAEGAAFGRAPAVVLMDPKYPHNVGAALRACACYGLSQLWFSGARVRIDDARERLPREERMRGYGDVAVINAARPLAQFGDDVAIVAVEVRDAAEPLPLFQHPEKAVYVFGPEDGSLDRAVLAASWRFVRIPTRHCLNLAAAVSTVLYDRALKRTWADQAG